MTRPEVIELIGNVSNNGWKDYFTKNEFESIMWSIYEEYRKYSNIDSGFLMTANAVLGMLDTNGGELAIREKYLK